MKVDSGTETSSESPSQSNRLFYRTLAGERPGLLAAIIAFNRNRNQDSKSGSDPDPAKDGLSDDVFIWAPQLFCKEFDLAFQDLKPFKGKTFSGDGAGFWDFKEESRRMALLPPPC